MSLELITAKDDLPERPALQGLINDLRQKTDLDGIVYYGWPNLIDYDGVAHSADVTVLTSSGTLSIIRYELNSDSRAIRKSYDSVCQLAALVESQLIKSDVLRKRRKLIVDVVPILLAPDAGESIDGDAEFFKGKAGLVSFVAADEGEILPNRAWDEVRSIVEGAKALSRPTPREFLDTSVETLGVELAKLEEVIANFDERQRVVAMTAMRCPQRIRGLAGTGKTVILAMKAALAHANDPSSNILITFYTRSLKDNIEKLITRFYRHFSEGAPDWDKIHIRHGWGRKDLPGVYRDAAIRGNVPPISFREASSHRDPFDFVCRDLVSKGTIKPYYDMILIDEGQDFPSGFYELCFYLAKGSRDQKQIVWAYDELQNLFNVKTRRPEELFGLDTDGKPRVSLQRCLPIGTDTNDHVLRRSYRNQRDVLVAAHALGFGIYGKTVQMLENKEHWEDVGYEILSGDFKTGKPVTVTRPFKNSPSALTSPAGTPLMSMRAFEEFSDEVSGCVTEVISFIEGGLLPQDIMVITLDDQNARHYLNSISTALAEAGVGVNNILLDTYNEPPFTIDGRVTLTSVYRAKGNEAAAVIVVGMDSVALRTRSGRNKIFVAMTRTKGWLRMSGIESKRMEKLKAEFATAQAHIPDLTFTMPDLDLLETIQRDLSEKHARLEEAKLQVDKIRDQFKLDEDDMKSLFE